MRCTTSFTTHFAKASTSLVSNHPIVITPVRGIAACGRSVHSPPAWLRPSIRTSCSPSSRRSHARRIRISPPRSPSTARSSATSGWTAWRASSWCCASSASSARASPEQALAASRDAARPAALPPRQRRTVAARRRPHGGEPVAARGRAPARRGADAGRGARLARRAPARAADRVPLRGPGGDAAHLPRHLGRRAALRAAAQRGRARAGADGGDHAADLRRTTSSASTARCSRAASRCRSIRRRGSPPSKTT